MLAAVIEAQRQSAEATVEFVEAVGLVEGGESAPRDLRMVQFRYSKLDENRVSREFVLKVPLLGMVDIPLVTVKKATFSFSYDITETNPSASKTPSGSSVPGPGGAPSVKIARPAKITGRFIRQPVQPVPAAQAQAVESREHGALQVTVELEKAPLPVGIDRILSMLELAESEAVEPSATNGGEGGGGGDA